MLLFSGGRSHGLQWYWIFTGSLIIGVFILFSFLAYRKVAIKSDEYKAKLEEYNKGNFIRDWIDITAWFVHKKDIVNTIAYDVLYDDALVEVKTEQNPKVITLTTEIFLESKKTILSTQAWERLDGQIASSLAQNNFQFSIPQSHRVSIIRQVYTPIDELQFRERVMDVFRARIPIIELWKEALRQSEKSILDK